MCSTSWEKKYKFQKVKKKEIFKRHSPPNI